MENYFRVQLFNSNLIGNTKTLSVLSFFIMKSKHIIYITTNKNRDNNVLKPQKLTYEKKNRQNLPQLNHIITNTYKKL